MKISTVIHFFSFFVLFQADFFCAPQTKPEYSLKDRALMAAPYVGGLTAAGGVGGFLYVRMQLKKDMQELEEVKKKLFSLQHSHKDSSDSESLISRLKARANVLIQRIKTLKYVQYLLLALSGVGALGGAGAWYYNNQAKAPAPTPEPIPAPIDPTNLKPDAGPDVPVVVTPVAPQPLPAPVDPDENPTEEKPVRYGISTDPDGRPMVHKTQRNRDGTVSRTYVGRIADDDEKGARGPVSEAEKALNIVLVEDSHPLAGKLVDDRYVVRVPNNSDATARVIEKKAIVLRGQPNFLADKERDNVGFESSDEGGFRVEWIGGKWVRTHKKTADVEGVPSKELSDIQHVYGFDGDKKYGFSRLAERVDADQSKVTRLSEWAKLSRTEKKALSEGFVGKYFANPVDPIKDLENPDIQVEKVGNTIYRIENGRRTHKGDLEGVSFYTDSSSSFRVYGVPGQLVLLDPKESIPPQGVVVPLSVWNDNLGRYQAWSSWDNRNRDQVRVELVNDGTIYRIVSNGQDWVRTDRLGPITLPPKDYSRLPYRPAWENIYGCEERAVIALDEGARVRSEGLGVTLDQVDEYRRVVRDFNPQSDVSNGEVFIEKDFLGDTFYRVIKCDEGNFKRTHKVPQFNFEYQRPSAGVWGWLGFGDKGIEVYGIPAEKFVPSTIQEFFGPESAPTNDRISLSVHRENLATPGWREEIEDEDVDSGEEEYEGEDDLYY